MNRLIIEVNGRYNGGICGPPLKKQFPLNDKAPESPLRKHEIVENFGRLHLYKDNSTIAAFDRESQLPIIRSSLVLVLGLSEASLIQIIDLLRRMKNQVTEIEIIKDQRKQAYLVVAFQSIQYSQDFFSRYQFRLMTDNSHLLCFFLKDIIYLKDVSSDMLEQSLLLGKTQPDETEWMQLPICMSCLEKIECKVSGINYITTGQYDQDTKKMCNLCHLLLKKEPAKCKDCEEFKDLWACLICAHIGCGRYKEGHAQDHRSTSNHTLAIELETERIWNYDSDSFAHRIIKSATGKEIMNFPQYDFDEHKLESVEGLFWQYCTKFFDELQKQRINYKNMLQDLEMKHKWEQKTLETELTKLQALKKQKLKELEAYKNRKLKIERRKQELRQQLDNQKQLNKLIEKQLRATKPAESQAIINKKKEVKELEERVAKLIGQLDFS